MRKHRQKNCPLPLTVIRAAAGGDVGAINSVLKHYESYITALSIRRMFDVDGNPHFVADPEMRRALETRLIVKVLQFDLNQAA